MSSPLQAGSLSRSQSATSVGNDAVAGSQPDPVHSCAAVNSSHSSGSPSPSPSGSAANWASDSEVSRSSGSLESAEEATDQLSEAAPTHFSNRYSYFSWQSGGVVGNHGGELTPPLSTYGMWLLHGGKRKS